MKFNYTEFPMNSREQHTALLDTGTTLFYMPKAEFDKFYGLINANNRCRKVKLDYTERFCDCD